jgi:hypothetical protein
MALYLSVTAWPKHGTVDPAVPLSSGLRRDRRRSVPRMRAVTRAGEMYRVFLLIRLEDAFYRMICPEEHIP